MRSMPAVMTVGTVLLIGAGVVIGFTGGAPPGSAGAPGQGTCATCHNSFPVNSGSADFHVFAPSSIAPGETVPITMFFGNTPEQEFGFALTVRDDTGGFVGSWTLTDPVNTRLIAGNQEVTQTSPGVTRSSWSVDWAAPAGLSASFLTFYACGLESNDDGAGSGDHVYTTSVTVPVFSSVTLQASSTNGDYSATVTGPAGHEYLVLASLNPTPGPWLGLVPDPFTFALLDFPPVVPGLHWFIGPGGTSSGSLPPGTLSALTGVPMRMVALTLDPAGFMSGFSDVVVVVP